MPDHRTAFDESIGARFARIVRVATDWPYILLLGIAAIACLSYLYAVYYIDSSDLVITGLQALTITLFGSYLTVVLIGGVFRKREAQQREEVRRIAANELRESVKRHLSLLANWYIVASDTPPSEDESLVEVLQGDFPAVTRSLALHETCSLTTDDGNETWLEYSQTDCSRLQNNVDSLVSKYIMYLDPQAVDDLRNFAHSDFVEVLQRFNVPSDPDPSRALLDNNEYESIAENHIQAVFQVADFVDKYAENDLEILYSPNFLTEFTTEPVGSARTT